MTNNKLVKAYLYKSKVRIEMLEFLHNKNDYSDVVREAQEVVELLLKALLKNIGIEAPKIHDVGKYIKINLNKMPDIIK